MLKIYKGWHIPTDAEWTTLSTLLGGDEAAGGKMKTTGLTRWNTPNTSATNESGFAGLPGNGRSGGGTFYGVGSGGYVGYWWSATQDYSTSALYRFLYNDEGTLYWNYAGKQYGFSVRCLRD